METQRLLSFGAKSVGTAVVAFLLAGPPGPSTARAAVIYSDTFSTGANGSGIGGRTPDAADLTGATYTATNRGSPSPVLNTALGNPAGAANTNFNGSAALPLSTAGSFTRDPAAPFTLSADLSVGNLGGSGGGQATPGSSTRGVGLGFYSSFTPGGGTGQQIDPNSNFTGFSLQNGGSNNGLLQFINAGTSVGQTGVTVLSGSLSTSAFYNLTFTVNPSTGNLVSASFNGTDITSSFSTGAAGAFTNAATAFAGFEGSSNAANNPGGAVDNFSVSQTPEPASAGLLTAAAAGLLARRRRA